MPSIKIIGTGSYLPKTVATNEDFSKFVDTSDEWIVSRTGIKQRRLSEGEPTWYMGLDAAKKAIVNAGISPEDIDMIIGTTVTGDYFFPSMSCIVQGKLGASNAFCIDINCACASFVYAMDMAARYMSDGQVKKVLIVSSENLSKTVDYTDRSTCVLFGDGAGAVVLSAEGGKFYSYLGSEGEGAEKIYAHAMPPSNIFMDKQKMLEYTDMFPKGKEHYMYMDGREVYKFTTRVIPLGIEQACKKAGISPGDLDLIIPHQANVRLVETAAKKLDLPMDKFYINIDRYGNTSSASIPLGLDELNRQGAIKSGNKIGIVGFGAGLSYGAAIFEF